MAFQRAAASAATRAVASGGKVAAGGSETSVGVSETGHGSDATVVGEGDAGCFDASVTALTEVASLISGLLGVAVCADTDDISPAATTNTVIDSTEWHALVSEADDEAGRARVGSMNC